MIPRPFALLLLAGYHGWVVEATESPYLKEILVGRCYDAPPFTKESGSCPTVAGSFMNILESHLDADIQPSHFDLYLKQVDVSSQKDKSIFYVKFLGSEDSNYNFVALPGFTTPEDTPGGAFLKDLVFCGVDQRENCSVENSKAYWSFWQALYAKFAAQVSGHVQIVLESEYSDIQFLIRSVVPQLQSSAVDSVTVYDGGRSCDDKRIVLLKEALVEQSGMDSEKIVCKDYDLVQFYLENCSEENCSRGATSNAATGTNDQQEEVPVPSGQEEKHNEEAVPIPAPPRFGKHTSKHTAFLVLIAAIVGLTCYCRSSDKKKGFNYDEEMLRNLIRIQYVQSQELLMRCLGFRQRQSNASGSEDGSVDVEETVSEGSPLAENRFEKCTAPPDVSFVYMQ